jgi:hypothetical protein
MQITREMLSQDDPKQELLFSYIMPRLYGILRNRTRLKQAFLDLN